MALVCPKCVSIRGNDMRASAFPDAKRFFLVKPTAAIMGAGLGKDVALITDGRFSGASHVRISSF